VSIFVVLMMSPLIVVVLVVYGVRVVLGLTPR
jgi:hypothetical protein